MAIFQPVATTPLAPPCRLAASAIDPEINTTSKVNTVSPLTDTLRLKTCMAPLHPLRRFVQHDAEQLAGVNRTDRVMNGRLRRHAGAHDQNDTVDERRQDADVGQRRGGGRIDDDPVESRTKGVDDAAYRRRSEKLRGMRRGAAGGQDGYVVFFDGHERLSESRAAGEDVGQSDALRQSEEPLLQGGAEVGVDDADALLVFLRHREPEVRGRQALAVATSRTRDEDDVDGAASLGVSDPRAERAILLGRYARRRHRGDQPWIQVRVGNHTRRWNLGLGNAFGLGGN